MSYKACFFFAAGLSKTLKVPIGTKEKAFNHVDWVEGVLEIEREQYLDNPPRWKSSDYSKIDDKLLCETVLRHNSFVRSFYDDLAKWAENPPDEFEDFSNDDFQQILPALNQISIPPSRWTGDFYTSKMETLYEVMRGRPTDGIYFYSRKLTERQAADVINLFSEFLDNDDRRLDVPKGQDYLASSYDGGYEWCEKCGAVLYEDAVSCRKRKCPLISYYKSIGGID